MLTSSLDETALASCLLMITRMVSEFGSEASGHA